MAEFQFRIRGFIQQQLDAHDRKEERSSSQKPRRFRRLGQAAASLVSAAIILIALDVYSSRFSGAVQGDAAVTRHEIGQLRETGGRRIPAQTIRGRRTTGGPNCDCNGVGGGLLEAQYRKTCLQNEQSLKDLYATGKLDLVAQGGKLVSGTFCNWNGPKAWPVAGGPIRKPPGIPEGTLCNPSGLSRNCQ